VLEYKETNASPNAQLALQYRCSDSSAACGSLPTSATNLPTSALQPAWNNPTSTVSPLGKVSFSHYDRPWTGDSDYSLVSLTGTNLITSYSYDSYGRLTQEVTPQGNAAATLDVGGNLSGSPDPNYVTSYSYYGAGVTAAPPAGCGGGAVNQLGLLQTKAIHGASVQSVVYDAAGRPLARTNGAGTTCLGYDSGGEGRLVSVTAPGDAAPTTYSYDPAGKALCAFHNNTSDDTVGAVFNRYDEAGRLTSSVDADGAQASYSYDADGNQTSRTTYPNGSSGSFSGCGSEITDPDRTAALQGDGRDAPDSSFGIWQATTNLLTNGGFEGGTGGWAAAGAATLSSDQTTSKFGGGSLEVTTPGSASGEGAQTSTTVALSAATPYSGSLWLNAPSGVQLSFCVQEQPSGTCHSQTVSGNGSWERVSQSFTTAATTTALGLSLTTTATTATSFRVDGAQIEATRIATPYVETDGTTSSRGLGLIQGSAALLDSGQGWVALRIRPEWSTANPPQGGSGFDSIFDWRTDLSHRYSLLWAEPYHEFEWERVLPSGTTATLLTVAISPGVSHTVVISWVDGSGLSLSVDGAAFKTTAMSGSFTPSLPIFTIGGNPRGTTPFDGEVLWAAAGSGSLGNADAATLNNFGDTDPATSQLPGSPSFGWAADTYSYQPATGPGGYTTGYGYNDADQLTSETDPNHKSYGFGYDTRGNLTTTQYPNSTYSLGQYDAAGWLTAVCNHHGTAPVSPPASGCPSDDTNPLADTSYTYDQEGQKTQETRTSGTITTAISYGYDGLGRLATVSGAPSGTPGTYCYDLDSDRTKTYSSSTAGCTDANPSATYTYTPGSSTPIDALTSQTGPSRSFTYNSDGEMTGRGTDTLGWDSLGRLHTTTVSGTTTTYSYDPTGTLKTRSTTSPSTTTNYLLGDLYETDPTGTITSSYQDGPAGDLASYTGPPTGTPTYLYYDGHGNLTAEADPTGTQTANHTYDPFGAPLDTAPLNSTLHRYLGEWDKQYDTSNNLILMGARPYDPTLGRFLSIDPIDGGSLNTYDYADQDPINNYDLDGTTPWGPCNAYGSRGQASCMATARGDWCNGGNARDFAACYPNGPASLDFNIIAATPFGGISIGAQVGTGGVRSYIGDAIGVSVGASVTYSNHPVEDASASVVFSGCSVAIACGSINDRGDRGVGVGVGLRAGAAVEIRHTFSTKKKKKR
jgi:RHS repeat-associated protein